MIRLPWRRPSVHPADSPDPTATLTLRQQEVEDECEMLRQRLANMYAVVDQLERDNAKLRAQPRPPVPGELAAARHTLLIYEDRLAAYEGRPSGVDCPRACCNRGEGDPGRSPPGQARPQ